MFGVGCLHGQVAPRELPDAPGSGNRWCQTCQGAEMLLSSQAQLSGVLGTRKEKEQPGMVIAQKARRETGRRRQRGSKWVAGNRGKQGNKRKE